MLHSSGLLGWLAVFFWLRPTPSEPSADQIQIEPLEKDWVEDFFWNREARWSERPDDRS
jgi:hypothetical protein